MRLLVLAILTCAAACGTTDESSPFDPPPPGGQQLASLPYTLAGGEEKYFCYSTYSPEEAKAVTEVQPMAGTVVHHTAIFYADQPEPEGFFECPELFKLTWRPIWVGGRGTNGLVLPPGTGFVIPPHTQYVVQYHLLNASDATVTERSAVNLRYADSASVTPVNMFPIGSFSLDIPAQATGFQRTIACKADRDMTVFAAFPHMHKLGKKIELVSGSTEATAVRRYGVDQWDFSDQPMEPVSFELKSGDYLRGTCTFDNPSGSKVVFGESTNDEMCFVVVFAYPLLDVSTACLQ